ncbi:glutaredoxin family protein [Candidatus Hydrogenedentota bacterium]
MSKNITIYSTSTCPYCTKIKTFLDENGIEYNAIDVGQDQAAFQKMVQDSGQMGVPVVDIDGKIILGFDKQAISEELGL